MPFIYIDRNNELCRVSKIKKYMDDKQKQLLTRIEAFSFDLPDTDFTFSQRLAKENDWNIEYTNRVIEEYRKFVFLAVVTEHIVTPSEQIDLVWHLHLTYTHSYWDEFCPHILGISLHHKPTKGSRAERVKYYDLYCQTLANYTKFFGNLPPEDIWSSPENRFGRDLSFKRVNTEKNWIIPKPNLSLSSTIDKINLLFKKQIIVIGSIFLVLLIFFGATLPSMANYAPFYWDFVNVNLDIQDNGDLLVTEEQKYVFTETNHSPEHYRFIKLDKIKAIEDVGVFENNHLLPIETATKDDNFWIKWQEDLDDTNIHIFTLKYRVIGAIKNSYGFTRLNWKAIFPKRDAPINNSQIVVNLPEFLAEKIKNYYSIGGNFRTSFIDKNTIKFDSIETLFPGESSIINVTFLGKLLNLSPIDRTTSKDPVVILISAMAVVIAVAIGSLIILVFTRSRSDNTVCDRPKSKSKSRNSNNSSFDSFGGCSSGCSSGCGGGCGGGG